jgi:hypothetical protein
MWVASYTYFMGVVFLDMVILLLILWVCEPDKHASDYLQLLRLG